MTLVALILLQDSYRLRWLLEVIGASFGFFGLKGGIFALATGRSTTCSALRARSSPATRRSASR